MTALDDYRAVAIQAETHPGAVVNPTEADKIRRDVIAEAYRALTGLPTADECRSAIAALGNKGPGK